MFEFEKFELLSYFPDILLILNTSSNIIYANKVACDSLEYSQDELEKLSFSDLLVDLDSDALFHIINNKSETGYNINLFSKNKDEVLVCLKFNIVDEYIYISGRTIENNNERIIKEFDELLTSAPLIMYILDNKRNIINCNKRFLDLIGEVDKEYVRKNFRANNIFQQIEKSFGENSDKEISVNDKKTNYHHIIFKGEKKIYLNSYIIPIYNINNIVIGLLVGIDDITDEVELSKSLNRTSYLLKAILDNVPIAIFWKDHNQKLLGYNQYLLKYFNFSRNKMTEKNEYDYYLNAEQAEIVNEDNAIINGDENFINKERTMKLDDESIVDTQITKVPLIVDNKIEGIIGIILDITAEKINRNKMNENSNLLENVLEAIPLPVYWKDLNFNCLGCNQSFLTFIDKKDKSQVIGEKSKNFYKHYNKYLMYELDLEVINTGRIINNEEFEFVDNHDKKKILRISKMPIYKNGKINGLINVFFDITKEEKYRKHLEYLSFHDGLTSLYNLAFFNEEIMRLDASRDLPISVVMLDVDGLKLINDTFGHQSGDDMLIKLANIIKGNCRKGDIIARVGGDEFAIILPKTTSIKCEEIVDRILNETNKEKVENITLSVSAGHDTKVSMSRKLQVIFAEADKKMYNAKLSKRSRHRLLMVNTILNNLFAKSNGERLHSYNVGEYAYKIAVAYHLDANEALSARLSGKLHDIGKIIIDKELLNSSKTKLTNSEWYKIYRHSEIGYSILSSCDTYSNIAKYVYYHHEHYDGTGYPKKLVGEKIPLISRIVHVADAIDAMNSNRPYREALSRDQLINELETCPHFDKKIVAVAIDLIKNNQLI